MSVYKNNQKMEKYGIMEVLELTVTRCGRWTGNREFVLSGLKVSNPQSKGTEISPQSQQSKIDKGS